MTTHLFLFGGSPPFTPRLAQRLANTIRKDAPVCVLFLERDGWEAYMPRYTSLLEKHGVHSFYFFALSSIPTTEQKEQLQNCTSIIICGGNTELYHEYIVHTEIGAIIQQRFQEGIPIAGLSAGALISPTYCVLSPHDTANGKAKFLTGLGLLQHAVIAVHYTKWNEEQQLRNALQQMKMKIGYGIDDHAGIYFQNDEIKEIEGFVQTIVSEGKDNACNV